MKTLTALTSVILHLILMLMVTSPLFAQNGINYQAVARDGSGNLLQNVTIDVQLTVLDASSSQVFQETHSGVTTNDYGLFTLVVGSQNSSGFNSIDWSAGDHQLKVEVDQGSGFVDMGTQDLQSVPYSLYSDMEMGELSNVNTVGIGDGQVLKWNSSSNEWEAANDNTGGSGGVNTDASISGDGTTGSPLSIAQQGASSGDVLQWDGSNWTPTSSGSSVWTESSGNAYYDGDVYTGGQGSSDGVTEFINIRAEGDTWYMGVVNDASEANSDFYIGKSNTDGTFHIENGGNVGIGTTSPSEKLQIEGGKVAIGSPAGVMASLTVNAPSGEEIFRGRLNGTSSFLIDEDVKMAIGHASPAEEVHLIQRDGVGGDNEALRIEKGIGYTSGAGNYWDIGVGQNTDNFKFYFNGSSTADIASSTGAYNQISDRRMKKDISKPAPVLAKVMQLEPKHYYYKNNEEESNKSYGFIAQEVEKLFPGFVSEMDEGLIGLAYDNFAVLAIQAIQEQQEQIDKLKEKNDKLQTKAEEVDELKQRVRKLEKLIKN